MRYLRLTLVLPIGVFLTVIAVCAYLISLHQKMTLDELRSVTSQMAATQAADIERQISELKTVSYLLAQQLPYYDDHGKLRKKVAALLRQYPSIKNVEVHRAGEPTLAYPALDYGAKYVLQEHLVGGVTVDSAKPADRGFWRRPDTVRVAVFDELLSIQSPVFTSSRDELSQTGSVVTSVDLAELLTSSGVAANSNGTFKYQFGERDRLTGEEVIFFGEGGSMPAETMTHPILVPGGEWFIRVGCELYNSLRSSLLSYGFAALFSIILALLSKKVLGEPERLRRLVAAQTHTLKALAYRDSLTELPNRRSFVGRLNTAVTTSNYKKTGLALLLIDLDNFKSINDMLGHDFGDGVLIAAASRIQQCLPSRALLARLAGDEFTVILSGTSDAINAEEIATAIVDAFAPPVSIGANKIHVSASVGIATLSEDVSNADELLIRADYAMYEAKANGRSGISVYSAPMQETRLRQMRLIQDLQHALPQNQLELLYQPIYCTRKKVIRKAEALLRWNHPELGVISPGEFIPLAEQSGLIQSIGYWVFTEAARQAKIWRDKHIESFQISVNVSASQFCSAEHIRQWLSFLEEINLPGEGILVEITESILLNNSAEIQRQLALLRGASIELALDDFGTGYSSLSNLQHFAIDYIKIDRSFTANLTECQQNVVLCDAIIKLASDLGMRVVAEGVETDEQLKLLADKGCHYSQGYLFSKPVSAQEFKTKFLQDTRLGPALLAMTA